MKQFLRCKACGFIIEESHLGDLCPACGVKKAMFIPNPEKISDKRRKLIDSHIHGIIVHMPQAFTFSLVILLASVPILSPGIKSQVSGAINVLSFVLPFSLIAAIISGIFDGKVRFKKVTTPLLLFKIKLGVIFFLLATTLATISFFPWQSNLKFYLGQIFLSIGCFVFSAIIGKAGASLVNAKFQG